MKKGILIITMLMISLVFYGVEDVIGKKFIEIEAQGWFNTKPLKISKLSGKIVIVEFWATWCPPCRRSIPHLIKLYNKYKDKNVVFISLTSESRDKVKSFMDNNPRFKMPYPIGYGSRSAGRYGVRGIPHAFIIDKNGKFKWRGHPLSRGFAKVIEKLANSKDDTDNEDEYENDER